MGRKKTEAQEIEDTPIGELIELWSGKILLSRISVQMELQVRRDGIDEDTVKEYCDAIQDPMDDMPPLAVFTTATPYNETCALLLADGFHRFEAYRRMGRETAPFTVYRGDESDALRYAIESNGKHGKALTARDREFSIRKALADPVMGSWSVRKIAGIVNCSKSLVQTVKNPPAPKPAKKREPRPDAVASQEPQVPVEGLANVGQDPLESHPATRFAAEDAPAFPLSDGPSVQPSVVRERQESTLPTKNERLAQFVEWVKEGHITRADVMNVFSNSHGSLVFLRSDLPAGRKTLVIRHEGVTLIEAEVTIQADLAALIDVSVEDPRTVEYSVESEMFAA